MFSFIYSCFYPPAPIHQSFHPFTHVSIHSLSLHWHTFKFISFQIFIQSYIYPLPLLTHILSTYPAAVLYPAFFRLSYTHILSCPSTYFSIISMPICSPSTYQFTHLPFIPRVSINRPIHPMTNLCIFMFNPIHFFPSHSPTHPCSCIHAPKYPW